MNLKLIDSSIKNVGYGARSGTTTNEEYECPCGIGKLFYEKDDIPGFKTRGIWCSCENCSEKYDFGRGTASEK